MKIIGKMKLILDLLLLCLKITKKIMFKKKLL